MLFDEHQSEGTLVLIARQFINDEARPLFGFLPIKDGVTPAYW